VISHSNCLEKRRDGPTSTSVQSQSSSFFNIVKLTPTITRSILLHLRVTRVVDIDKLLAPLRSLFYSPSQAHWRLTAESFLSSYSGPLWQPLDVLVAQSRPIPADPAVKKRKTSPCVLGAAFQLVSSVLFAPAVRVSPMVVQQLWIFQRTWYSNLPIFLYGVICIGIAFPKGLLIEQNVAPWHYQPRSAAYKASYAT
jgi:hypothetical protein